MVRRRSRQSRIEDSAPDWALTFIPDQWPGESWPERWNNWRTGVRDFAATLRATDPGAWLHLIRNLYSTRSNHWADLARERTDERNNRVR